MPDLIDFLSTVNWPGALIVCFAFWFAARVIVGCYGRRS